MENRKTHTQATAAAKAGISERTARRIETGKHQFKELCYTPFVVNIKF